jgi:uncharacterized membrane protein YkvI
MIAGTYSMADILNYNKFVVVFLTLILAFLVVKNNVEGISKVNIILVPIMILVLIFTIKSGDVVVTDSTAVFSSFVSGGSYVFINIVSLGLLVVEIGQKYSKKEKFIISVICGIIITLLLIGINYSILTNGLCDNMMPNLYLSNRNNFLYFIMKVSLYVGLFTTLISNIFLLKNFLLKYVKNSTISIVISLIFSALLSMCGFDKLVGCIYLFIAFVGLLMVVNSTKFLIQNIIIVKKEWVSTHSK